MFMDFFARLVTQKCHQQGVLGFRVAYRIYGQLVPAPAAGDAYMDILMLLYADDLVLMADSAAGLKLALEILEQTSGEWCMEINYSKTEAVVFGERTQEHMHVIQLHGGQVEHVADFRYLGSIKHASVKQDMEISTRRRQAGFALHELYRRVFSDRAVTLETKMRIYKAVVVPILLHDAAESWAPTSAQLHQLDVFNNNCLRRILHERLGPDAISNADLYVRTRHPAMSALLMEWGGGGGGRGGRRAGGGGGGGGRGAAAPGY